MSHLTLVRDPMRAVYDALEAAGCDPRGPLHKFIARCPGHEDGDPSLSVSVGADGRALIWCHSGCETRRIIELLDISWSELFPAGHRHARPLRGVAKPIRPLDLVLQALLELHIPYRCTRDECVWVAELCPVCRRSDRWPLWIVEECRVKDDDAIIRTGRVSLSCANGCEQIDVVSALVGAEA